MFLVVPRGNDDDTVFSGICPAPEITLGLLLQHHVVVEELRQRDLGMDRYSDERHDGAD